MSSSSFGASLSGRRSKAAEKPSGPRRLALSIDQTGPPRVPLGEGSGLVLKRCTGHGRLLIPPHQAGAQNSRAELLLDPKSVAQFLELACDAFYAARVDRSDQSIPTRSPARAVSNSIIAWRRVRRASALSPLSQAAYTCLRKLLALTACSANSSAPRKLRSFLGLIVVLPSADHATTAARARPRSHHECCWIVRDLAV